MTDQPILTIAVPTYNRATYLDLCLGRINEEIDSLSEDQRCLVRVCVADNGSTDDTPLVVSNYQRKFKEKLEAIRASENMGMDFNFARCYELAKTPYVWLVGDDDVLLVGGLKKVLDVLVENKIDILYVNNYWFQHGYNDTPKIKEAHGSTIFQSPLRFARRTNVMLTYLSGLIVRSGIGGNYRCQLAGSNIVQLSWVLPLLRDGRNFMIIEDWIVAAQGANSGGYGLVKVFGTNLVKITNEILKDMPAVARAIQNGAIVNFFPSFILEFRKGSSKFLDKEMASGLEEAFGNNWRYSVILAPLIHLPLCAASCYNVLLKVFRRIFRLVLV